MTHGSNRVSTSSSFGIWKKRLIFVISAVLWLAAQRHSLAGSATWSQNPTTNDWNTAGNWTPNTVPNGPSDVASFFTSNLTEVAASALTEISGINFSPGADSFTITAKPGVPLIISGTGVINASNNMQTFVGEVDGGFTGGFFFENSATPGERTVFTGAGAYISFNDSATAAQAEISFAPGPESQQGQALTFKADATYTYTFKAKRNRARTDKVIANGITINSGAMIALSGQIQGALRQGLVLTLISNTSANPISGTFANLPDGGIVTINGNNFQASYSGGDGNDLTLMVVQ